MASGRIPGYVGAVRLGGATEVRAAGARTLDGPPMQEDTQFRIASLTKPIGGVLLLSLVEDGILALDDPVAEWLPEAATPRVLVDPAARSRTPCRRAADHAPPPGDGDLRAGARCSARARSSARWSPAASTPGRWATRCRRTSSSRGCARSRSRSSPARAGSTTRGINLLGVADHARDRAVADRVAHRARLRAAGDARHGVRRRPRAARDSYKPSKSGLTVVDPPDGRFSRAPAFEELNGGLVSTAADLLRFFTGMADGRSSATSRAR